MQKNKSFQDQIVQIIARVYTRRFSTTSGGNISIIEENGDMWITPSAIDKGSLKAEDIIHVGANGHISGPHQPSSEHPFHRAIYNIRNDIKSIVHVHSPSLVAFAIARKVPDANLIFHTREICGNVGYAKYETPGSEELGESISKEFEKGANIVIMENHGVVAGGTDIYDAFQRLEALELLATSTLLAQPNGKPISIQQEEADRLNSLLQQELKESATPMMKADALEEQTRELICRFTRRALMQGLMSSANGTISVRLDADNFVITPTGGNRWEIDERDLVKISHCCREAGKDASRNTILHWAIYNQFPDINSIILAQPDNLMAFAINHKHMDVRTIPESWIFLQDVPGISFANQIKDFEWSLYKGGYSEKAPTPLEETSLESDGNFDLKTQDNNAKGIFTSLDQQKPTMILHNNAFLSTGKSLLEAFDKLEVAEFSAKSILFAETLGSMIPISDAHVEALRKKYL